jgi:hypothetical protein
MPAGCEGALQLFYLWVFRHRKEGLLQGAGVIGEKEDLENFRGCFGMFTRDQAT